ncbi:MAG TPA: hypothetical protein VMR14_12475 [Streptosporangiaceae bacterium]|jgi:hypothetical protein|nr:hypothetical protein [Streptosporangiaceae bacterium]
MGGTTITTCAAGLAAGLAVGALAAGYQYVGRNRQAGWGATSQEAALRLPGDDVIGALAVVTTRAVSITAPTSCVWPWLVQLGSGRGGFYSYDWAQNLLGLDVHSANVILPQFQNVEAGDGFPLIGGRGVMKVEAFEPESCLALSFELGRSANPGRWVASFALFPQYGVTRLVSRSSVALPSAAAPSVAGPSVAGPRDWLPWRTVGAWLLQPALTLFERKMLLGIKDRAERYARGGASAADLACNYLWAGEHL